jgi:hypothetical protein
MTELVHGAISGLIWSLILGTCLLTTATILSAIGQPASGAQGLVTRRTGACKALECFGAGEDHPCEDSVVTVADLPTERLSGDAHNTQRPVAWCHDALTLNGQSQRVPSAMARARSG